jgi:hypothetical protein
MTLGTCKERTRGAYVTRKGEIEVPLPEVTCVQIDGEFVIQSTVLSSIRSP